jgi:hypothetical protein
MGNVLTYSFDTFDLASEDDELEVFLDSISGWVLDADYHVGGLVSVAVGLESDSIDADISPGTWERIDSNFLLEGIGRIVVFWQQVTGALTDYTVTADTSNDMVAISWTTVIDPELAGDIMVGTTKIGASSASSPINLPTIIPGWIGDLDSAWYAVYLTEGPASGSASPLTQITSQETLAGRELSVQGYDSSLGAGNEHAVNPGSLSFSPSGDAIAIGFGVAQEAEITYPTAGGAHGRWG